MIAIWNEVSQSFPIRTRNSVCSPFGQETKRRTEILPYEALCLTYIYANFNQIKTGFPKNYKIHIVKTVFCEMTFIDTDDVENLMNGWKKIAALCMKPDRKILKFYK